jgi:hypothetical protein
MKNLKTFALSFILAATSATLSFAQDHHHKSPHGGEVKDAGGYHIEMVKTKTTLNFYLLGSDEKPSDKKATGKVEFEFSNKTKSTSALTTGEGGSLKVDLPKANIVDFANVTLTVDGKEISAKFKNAVSDAAKAHGHEHK